MKIAKNVDVSVGVFDIETYLEVFDFGIYDPDIKKWVEFEISAYCNDLYKFVAYYTKKQFDYWVSYNGVMFDHQVLQYIVDNHQKWVDLTGLEICKLISDYSGKLIDDGRYNIPPFYKEYHFPVKVIDVFKIQHFDNEAKRTSLKWCEFMLNMDVEEMPVHHLKTQLTQEEIEKVKFYRRKDVIATLGVFYLTLGQMDKVIELVKEETGMDVTLEELNDYKGKNKIEDRLLWSKEMGMDCMNWSDVKVGEEWNKKDYKDSENIKDDNVLFSKSIKAVYGRKFKQFFPPTMSFTTEKMQKFFEELGEEYVLAKKQEFPLTIGKTTYTIAKGGLHSTEKHRAIIPLQGDCYEDIDVGAQYPNSILKLQVYPPHLKPTIIVNFEKTVYLKDDYKQQGKLEKDEMEKSRLKGLETSTKLRMNGGFFGKLGQPGSFLEYPEGLLKVCMGNQIEILMLIEMLEVKDFQVMSGNTDGLTVYYPDSREKEFLQICRDWEHKVGNAKLGKLEHAKFKAVWQESINHYIAEKRDGEVKKKGRFMTEYEMHKNKSKRIIALALEAYFIKKKDPIQFIREHRNIFDFCIGKKGYGDLHYEELDSEGQKIASYDRVLRYYISKDGNIIKKRGWHLDKNNSNVYMDSYCEAMDKEFPWLKYPLLKVFNRPYQVEDFSLYNVDYDFYIIETLDRIDKIEKKKRAANYAERFKPQQQISMF